MNLPKVSIIMATYNRAHFIVETVQSIQNQIYKNWECLIIDDGGIDNTLEVIQPIIDSDKRFQFLKRTNKYKKGLPGCRNYGLDLAKGEFIIFFDDDDIVHPQNLEICVSELTDKSMLFCIYGRNTFINKFHYNFEYSKEYNSRIIDISYIERIVMNEFLLNSCSVMWKRECLQENQFNENLMYAEDWELYTRILSSGIKGIYIDKCLFFGRKHIESNTGEFYNNNPIRKASKKDAILLVVKNLKTKKLLSPLLFRYFVQLALTYKEFGLFDDILAIYNPTLIERLKWKIFYTVLPLFLFFYKIKKKLLNFLKTY